MSFTIASCGSCRAPIVWAITEHGNSMPVNASASDAGNIILHPNPVGAPLAEVLADTTGHTGLYVSHFATCPNAAQHRKRS